MDDSLYKRLERYKPRDWKNQLPARTGTMSQSEPEVFELLEPSSLSSPLVIDSPHSGNIYPDDFGFCCSLAELVHYEDSYVDLLALEGAAKAGVPFLKALFPRTYIDPNRAETDIPDSLKPEDWPLPTQPTLRSQGGHGLIREIIGDNTHLYNRKLASADIEHRIMSYYRPYHSALSGILNATREQFGSYYHLSLHSMPASATSHLYLAGQQPDIVLGDRDGTSCSVMFRRQVQDVFQKLGYRVAVNTPYKGVEITRRYGQPSLGQHSLQVEIRKDLYMDEKTLAKTNNFNDVKRDIEFLIQEISGATKSWATPLAAD